MEINGTGNTPHEIENIARLNCHELADTDVQEIRFWSIYIEATTCDSL